jgi:ATP-dependent Lhr-like helicase
LEAQGLIRGGRFVAGFTGEQYALPDAVGALRAVRRRAGDEAFVALSAADPLNLVGIVTPGARVPALASNRILLRAGVPVAVYIGGETRFLAAFDPPAEWAARNALLQQKTGMRLATPVQ